MWLIMHKMGPDRPPDKAFMKHQATQCNRVMFLHYSTELEVAAQFKRFRKWHITKEKIVDFVKKQLLLLL